MKRITFALLLTLLITSCSSEKQDLYKKVDFFIDQLHSTYESYGLQGINHAKHTPNGYYCITPIGRLINVKIEKPVDSEEYEKLKADLSRKFKNDKRVNLVYICNGGTVMIDCRN